MTGIVHPKAASGTQRLFRGGLSLLRLRSTPFSFPALQTPVEQGAPWAAAPSGLPSVRHCGEWKEGRGQGPSCLHPGVSSSGSISSVVLLPPRPTEPSQSYPGSPYVWETPPAPSCPTPHLTCTLSTLLGDPPSSPQPGDLYSINHIPNLPSKCGENPPAIFTSQSKSEEVEPWFESQGST